MAKLEREDEAALCAKVFKNLGVLSLKLNLQGNRGWPDRVFLLPLRPLWFEFKRKDERPRKLQLHRIKTLRDLGYDAYWSYDYDESYRFIETLYAARLSEIRDKEDGGTGLHRPVT